MSESVQLLILGAGWTAQFLEPLLHQRGIAYAATTTTGRNGTIPFKFDPESTDTAPYQALPTATTVLITFPLTGPGQSRRLTDLYHQVHDDDGTPHWIQLGSTGIFKQQTWNDEDAEYDAASPRAVAEDELLGCARAVVLNLAGLYGGSRMPKNWLGRVAQDKEMLKAKTALHLVHGEDVARAIVAVHQRFEKVAGKRWIVTDLMLYDWWQLALVWDPANGTGRGADAESDSPQYARWVQELMLENGVRALPRAPEVLGRRLDSRGFWSAIMTMPSQRNALTF